MANSTSPAPILDGVKTLQAQYDGSEQMRAIMGVRPTLGNLQDVGNPILTYGPSFNAWCADLVNRILEVIVWNPVWTNPLDVFKSNMIPYGTDVQEIHINPAQENEFVPCDNAKLLLECCPVDVAAAYHRLNRESQYCTTIVQTEAEKAFVNGGDMTQFVNGLVNTIFTGNQIDEWQYTQALFGDEIANGTMQIINVPDVTDQADGLKFTAMLKTLSYYFTLPTSTYNNYVALGGKGNPRITWTPFARQAIIMRADVKAFLDVNVLASAFNMSMVQLERQIYLVPYFIDKDGNVDEDTLCVLCDMAYPIIKDKTPLVSDFFNPQGWTYKYLLTPRQLYSISPFANAVAIRADDATTEWPAIPKPVPPTVTPPTP